MTFLPRLAIMGLSEVTTKVSMDKFEVHLKEKIPMKTNLDPTSENPLTGEDLANGLLAGLGFMFIAAFLIAVL